MTVAASPATPPAARRSRTADDRFLRGVFRHNARTFALASRLLPRRTRLPVATLYYYCRTIDEIADRRPARAGASDELSAARHALSETIAGRPPAFGSTALLWTRLSELHEEFDLDTAAMEELLDGAEWDLEGRPIRDTADLMAYSDLVAGSVGAMMLPLLVDEPGLRQELVAPARALGRAMQVTNILRDVGEDRDRLGRAYLPADALQRHGVTLGDVGPRPSAGYIALCEEIMALAEDLYAAARPGIGRLPAPTRTAVRAAGLMYREILNEIRRAGYDNLTRRAVVPPARKLLAVAGGYESRKARLKAGARSP